MSSVTVSAPAVAAFGHALGQAGAELADLEPVNTAAGDLVLGAARIPRRTGRLDQSAHVVGSTDGFTLVAGGVSAPYAPLVHARNPFLLDPLTAHESDVVDLYLGHAERVLDHL